MEGSGKDVAVALQGFMRDPRDENICGCDGHTHRKKICTWDKIS